MCGFVGAPVDTNKRFRHYCGRMANKRFHKGFVSILLVNIYFIVYFLTELDPKSGFSIDEVFH